MKSWLKEKPLAFQIWLILGLVMTISLLIFMLLMPIVLKNSFTNESFARIEEAQRYFLEYDRDQFPENSSRTAPDRDFKRHPGIVRHIFITEQGNIRGREITSDILLEVINSANEQREDIKQYSTIINEQYIMYIIRKVEINGEKGYLASYLLGAYRDSFMRTTILRLLSVLLSSFLINWIASLFIARYLTSPLLLLKERVKDIAARKWDKEISLDRNDEIGQLAETIDWMRCQLIEHNKKQEDFLQQVSHEFKTPIMVIRSYACSIREGIFPQGNLENSLKVIEEETERMEKRVRLLLNISKIDYLSVQSLEKQRFNFTKMLEKLVEKFTWYRKDIHWQLNTEEIDILADKEKLIIAIENLFDNQIRYAKEKIIVNAKKVVGANDNYILLKIWNDGPVINPEVINEIFDKYKMGFDGKHGLGLAIVKTVVKIHQGQIWVENEGKGVSFYIKLDHGGLK
ncbi:sensor histidine kinase [Natronospora cellulosivora (SeqCode)]